MLADLRYAFRLLLRQPGTTAVILLTLALGIGANTAVFSAVHAALLRPLPYPEPDQLVLVWEKRPAEGRMNNPVSPADFLDWVRLNRSFSALAAYTPSTADLTGHGEPVQLAVAYVSATYFDVFGIQALHGRTFAPGEDTPGRHHVVVLGHALWQQRLGAEVPAIGRKILLDERAHEIVGVLPPEARLPGAPADLWVPLVLEGPTPPVRVAHVLDVYGRRKAGVSLDQARNDMDRVGDELAAAYPDENEGHGASVVPLHDDLVRFGLIAFEVAAASMLLVAAGLTLRSFARVLAEDPGVALADRLTMSISLPRARYPDDQARRQVFAEIEEQLAAVPQIRAAGAVDILPLGGQDSRRGLAIEGRERRPGDPPTRAHPRIVTPTYFDAAGIRIREGRGFQPHDDQHAPPVVVVNETMARRYWPGQSALGRRVTFSDESWREIVGVAADLKHWGLDREVNPMIYLPQSQLPSPSLTFVLHTSVDPLAVAPAVRRRIQTVDPNLAVAQVRTMEDVAAETVTSRRWTVVLLAVFALLALALATAGIYGVMAHVVSLRTAEIGIRLSLGARPVDVMRQVLGEGLLHASVGLGLGLAASLALMGGIRTLLFGIEPSDRVTLVSVSGLLLAVAALATIIPARRAMRVNPIEALREASSA